MAHLKYARAHVMHADQSVSEWGQVRTASDTPAVLKPSTNLIQKASEIFEQGFDPTKYLLTHATIVASVDTYVPSGGLSKTGKVTHEGKPVNRKFADYRVTADTDRFINNNHDCWPRNVLLQSYQSFIGAQNFLEHVQVEDLSKGRIIDAVARDIGPSVYVDILVATDLNHTELIKSIRSGKMSTLSMGCTVDATQCNYCGNWAHDETEMCEHIKYAKGNMFFDEFGKQVRIAELCGHPSIDPDGGVQFIEASWVATPAFRGAVLRNILNAENITDEMVRKAQNILSTPPQQWVGMDLNEVRTASNVRSFEFDEEGGEEEEGGGEEAPEPANPLDDLETEVTNFVMERVKKSIRDRIQNKPPELSPSESSAEPNDSIIHQANRAANVPKNASQKKAFAYKVGIHFITGSSTSDRELVSRLATFNRSFGLQVPRYVYKAAFQVGSCARYASLTQFMQACGHVLGRVPTIPEAKTLIRIGKLLSTTPE